MIGKSILIADSGSTKTHWFFSSHNGRREEYYCSGINPYFMDERQIVDLIKLNIPEFLTEEVDSIYFYGAGCSNDEKCSIVQNALKKIFVDKHIEVSNDLLASARALFGDNLGVACILGTGSNAAIYNGAEFSQKIKSLGFMLGDEGSGAYIGKKLLTDFLHNEMPLYLAVDFNETFKIDYHQVLDKIYKQDFPNRYLASFTTFASKHIREQYIVELLENAFDAFIKYQLETLDFDKTTTRIGFIGSVAFHFKDILINRLEINNYKCSKILSDPMDDLFDYHINK